MNLLNISGGGIKGAFLRRVKIKVRGTGNKVIICPKVMMRNCNIHISGIGCKVYIEGGRTNIHHCNIEVNGENSEVHIKKGFTTEQVSLKACEGRKIIIGEDCMFSAGIYISTTDFHSIVNTETQARVNPAKDVHIGNHVWLAHGVSVLKGAIIDDNIVVGKSSIVTGKLDVSNSVYVGNPAKKVKTGISWKREL
jgi:acetyltransferase-like isoleucine patch superfamily enzyme